MKQASKLIEWIKQIPIWVKTVITFVGAILTLVSFFLLFRDNFYVLLFVIIPLLIVTIILLSIYLNIAKTEPLVAGGYGVFVFSLAMRIAARTLAIIAIILGGFYYASESGKRAVGIAWYGTPTSIPTQTLTLTPSPTVTLTPTPKPISDSLYYMIVYDSSMKMEEAFHGQKKWDVARNLLVEIINGLNPRAQYSLVTIGGSNSTDIIESCDNPISPVLPFSSRQIAYNYLGSLQPQGGGSFYRAYTLAKKST